MRRLLISLPFLVATGCTSPPGVPIGAGADPDAVETTTVVAGETATARERVAQAFDGLGLTASTPDATRFTGRFDATSDWAFCRPIVVEIGDHDRLVDMASGRVRVEVRYSEVAAGTRVTIEPGFTATYTPRGLGRSFERRCNTYGVLEQEALAAIAGNHAGNHAGNDARGDA